MILKSKSVQESIGTDNLSTVAQSERFNPYQALEQFEEKPVVLVAVAIEPKGSRTGRLEERGAWIQALWSAVRAQQPRLHGCRLGWDSVFFIGDTTAIDDVQEKFRQTLQSLRDPALESRCILSLAEGTALERGQMLDEMQHDLTAPDVGGYVRFKHRLLDGTYWTDK